MFWFGRRSMSRSWLNDYARKETCEGWPDSVGMWLKSEAQQKERAAWMRRFQLWRDARDKHAS
jgi:hypothetical protein